MSITNPVDIAPKPIPAAAEPDARTRPLLWLALLGALAGLGGSLFLSLGMALKACPLCFYQRTFMMSLVGVLGMGLLAGAGKAGRLALLALPLAVGGLGVACFHVWLEMSGKLECPEGALGLGTAPKQSLVLFLIVFVILLMEALLGTPRSARRGAAAVGGIVLGGLLALASCTSNPPVQAPPREAYSKPPDGCRPPLQAQGRGEP